MIGTIPIGICWESAWSLRLGTSDACLLTNYNFIRHNLDPYGGDKKFGYYVADEKPVQLFDNAQVRNLKKQDAKKWEL